MTAGIAGAGLSAGGQGVAGIASGVKSVEAPITPKTADVERFRSAMSQGGTPQANAAQAPENVQSANTVQQVQETHRATGGDRILNSMERMRTRGVDMPGDVQRTLSEVNAIMSKPSVSPADVLRFQGQMMTMGMRTSALSGVERNTTQGLEKVLQAQ